MTATRVDEFGVVRCVNDPAHRITTRHADHVVTVICAECQTFDWDELASTEWYDNHSNLALLIGWQDDHDRARFLTSILEKPWKYEDEFLAAKACADHELATGHTVNRDPDGDCLWYCNDCPRRHGYDHECCKHDDPSVGEGVCCACDAESPCFDEQERAAQEDRDPERVSA